MNFLIQTINGEVVHDFSFELIEACKFNNWFRDTDEFRYELTDSEQFPDFIPVGTVEFVCSYLDVFFGKVPKPKNIPDELLLYHFTNRRVLNGTEKDVFGECFVKSNDVIKGFCEITDKAPKGNYQISELIEVDSEYRCFVFDRKLVGLQNYCGDFTLFPDISIIEDMIMEYKTSPIAYTLDVGISNGITFVIEVHDFFSCGLYGFSNHSILPHMFNGWFKEFVRKECSVHC